MNTAFRMDEITQIDNNRALYQVDLRIIDDDDLELLRLNCQLYTKRDGR